MKRCLHISICMLLVAFFLLEYPYTACAAYAQIYLKESAAGISPTCQLGKFEPPFGALVGATIDKDVNLNGDLNRVESVYGRPYSAVLIYATWGGPFPTDLLNEAKAGNAAVQVSWEPSCGLNCVKDDSYVRGIAKTLKNFGGPVFLRFGGEMNGDWTAWGGQPELYKAKFRLIASVMRQDAPNVAMVWSPNFVPYDNLDAYYPGDEWVDWVGINGYQDYYFAGNPANDSQSWTWAKFYQGHKANPLTKFQRIYNTYSARKPIMIAETGVCWANRSPYQLVDSWGAKTLQDLYGYIPLLYPRIKAVFYFNSGVSADFSAYNVSQNATMTAAYGKAISSPYYLSSSSATSPFYYHVLGTWLPSPISDLAAYVDAGQQQIAYVEYYLDGVLAGKSFRAPWDISCLFKNSGGTSRLEVRAIDYSGAVVARQTADIRVPVWNPVRVELNGALLTFDVPPALYNNRTMVPVAKIAESLGAQVTYIAYNNSVLLTNGSQQIQIFIDQQKMLVNNQPVTNPDFAVKLVGGRTLVPLTFIAENFGVKVIWDGATGTVKMSK